jgi:CMP/dCMP kinase
MSKTMIIAIDGPAASGKGTLARRLAAHFGLRHLDTGLTYRAVAQALLLRGLPLDEEQLAEETARKIDISDLSADTLWAHSVGEAASQVAVMPAVRRVLVEKQRDFAKAPPGAVLDGRDIGTVVFPEAAVKLYVTASPFVRAERRYREIVSKGGTASFARLLTDIQKRDARDMGRSDSPLKPADDAHLLDTSQMDIDTAFDTAKDLIEKAFATTD